MTRTARKLRTRPAALAAHHRKLDPIQKILRQDVRESLRRKNKKTTEAKNQWGKNWPNMVRSGRQFTRVQVISPITAAGKVEYVLRPEPGWQWTCFNCKTGSLVTEKLIAIWKVENEEIRTDMMAEWEALAKQSVERGFKPPVKPTPATAGCPNCKARPGAPE